MNKLIKYIIIITRLLGAFYRHKHLLFQAHLMKWRGGASASFLPPGYENIFLLFLESDNGQFFAGFNVARIERCEEDVLVFLGLFSVVNDLVQSNPPVNHVHEHVKFIQDPDGRMH